jgi:hypothetical protein
MTEHEKLVELCHQRLKGMLEQEEQITLAIGECSEQLSEDHFYLPDEETCKNRLTLELDEIKRKDEAWMFLRFYNAVKKGTISRIEKNEHNLFIWYVLDVCTSVNMDKGPAFTEAELPDIDVDYHPIVREYLKDDFSFRQYGKPHVCNIASYQTYGIKSSLIDMARVLGHDRMEINSITTRMGLKDEEGDDVTFEGLEEKFKKIEEKIATGKQLNKFDQVSKELGDYRKRHADVWEAAKQLVAAHGIDWKDKFSYGKPPRRKKSMGCHASGLIIAGVNLSEFVPLVVPPGSREQGLQASAWVEGLADTDCSSVGLIKFDYLSLEANAKVAECNRLIMLRHGLESVNALPGLSNWSDTSYLNDPKALAMAAAGDLKGVFQFDSSGIRKLAKKGGVTSFDDLVAYSALYRPGPMDEGMHDEYCDRKNGKKEYEVHPLLKAVLGKTYGVLVYQEQVMRVLNIVGDIPLKDCEAVRKAISKKKEEKFKKYEQMFLENGQKKLGVDIKYLHEFWAQIKAFAGYGFNLSHAVAYTYISARQLWQKAHYPLEFYTAALRSLKTADERITTYIHDARRHDIHVKQLDLNKSKENFEITNDEIYYGFGKVKRVGQAASKIVELQPYRNFQDFLEKFGTEAKVLQPLIALKVFKDGDPLTLYLYYEAYKKAMKARLDRKNRNIKSVDRYMTELNSLLDGKPWEHGFDDSHMGKLRAMLDDDQWLKLCKLKKKYDKCIDTFEDKNAEEINLSIKGFDPKSVKLSKQALKAFKAMKPILKDVEGAKAEIEFYGFPWMNDFERCPNYKGFTFEEYEIDIMRAEEGVALPVEVCIMSVEHAQSKSGKMWYWKLRVMDALDAAPKSVTVWEHDYDRFESLLQVGNIVRMRLFPPQSPYPNYSLEGCKPWEMWGKKNSYGEDPAFDTRVVLLARPSKRVVEEEDEYDRLFADKTVEVDSDDEESRWEKEDADYVHE